MKETFFKLIGQKVTTGKMILVAVVENDFINNGDVPEIFECQSMKEAPTIYTGTYPSIKINTNTIKDRTDLAGKGINGILTSEDWYCVDREKKDLLNIGLSNRPKI